MGVLDFVSPQLIHSLSSKLSSSSFLVVDANVPPATIDAVLEVAWRSGVPVMYEPTSAAKASKLSLVPNLHRLTFIKPNLSELFAIAHALRPNLGQELASSTDSASFFSSSSSASFNPSSEEIDICLNVLLSAGIQNVLLTMGSKGVKLARIQSNAPSSTSHKGQLIIESFPAEVPQPMVDVNGAGDSFASGFIFGFLSGLSPQQAVKLGLRAARLTCETDKSVSSLLGPSILSEFAHAASAL